MSNFWCDITTGVCSLLLAFLSFVDSITKKSYSKRHQYIRYLLDAIKTIAVKIIIVLAVAGLIIYTTWQKNNNIATDKILSDKLFKQELDKRDQINLKNFQISLQKSSSASATANAETMAKYYLRYDSIQHKIEKIVKDSSKKISTFYSDAKPEFDVSDIKFIKSRNDTLEFKITLACKKTAIEKLNLSAQLFLLKRGDYSYVPQIKGFIPPDVYMSSNTIQVIDYVNINSLKNIFEAYFHIFGSYYYGERKIVVDFILFYDFRDSNFGIPGNKIQLADLFKAYSL